MSEIIQELFNQSTMTPEEIQQMKDEEHKRYEERVQELRYQVVTLANEMSADELAETIKLIRHRNDIKLYFNLQQTLTRQLK